MGAFKNLKKKQLIAFQDLDDNRTESKCSEAVEHLEVDGSSWVNERIAMFSFFHQNLRAQICDSYGETPKINLSEMIVQNKRYIIFGFWRFKCIYNPPK